MRWWLACLLAMALCSCQPVQSREEGNGAIRFLSTESGEQSVALSGALNEWMDFTVRVGKVSGNCRLRLTGLDQLGPDARWFRVENSGRALVPMVEGTSHASADLSGDGTIWIDLHIPEGTPAGDYRGACQFVRGNHSVAEIPVAVHVYPFSLPSLPRLTIAGEVTSAGLRRIYSGNLPATVEPLIEQCQQNRAQLWFSELQPLTAWPADRVTWRPPADESEWPSATRDCVWSAKFEAKHVLLCQDALTAVRGPSEWFYSGGAFGVDGPVESVLLKRLRDSEEDFEYLAMAERIDASTVRQLNGLLVRPMEGNVDPVDQPLGGPLDLQAFDQAKEILARIISGPLVSERQRTQWNLQMIRWIAAHDRARILARSADWSWDAAMPGQLDLKLGMDIYNPSNIQANGNTLEWSQMPSGWRLGDIATVTSLLPYHVTRSKLTAVFDATPLHITTNGAAGVKFISKFDGSETSLMVNLPVASCDRRAGSPVIDGSLSDWSSDDEIYSGPKATILSNFSNTRLFFGFHVAGTDTADCELLIQPMYADNSLGKLFQCQCHPDGQSQSSSGPVQYASTNVKQIWRGEIAISWRMILGSTHRLPSALRFNFVQHGGSVNAQGWAGEVDGLGNMETMSGILVLRDGPGRLIKLRPLDDEIMKRVDDLQN